MTDFPSNSREVLSPMPAISPTEGHERAERMAVANTIVEQLGGRKFIAMTGARNFVGSETGVSFRLPGGGGFCKNGINCVRIELEPSDTYTVTFLRMRKQNGVPATMFTAIYHDIYADSLQELFTRETGLAVSL